MKATDFKDIIEQAGYRARSYSGRGMCGAQCVGVTTKDSLTELTVNLIRATDSDEFDEVCNLLERTKSDSMGLSCIFYWPSVELEDEDLKDFRTKDKQ